MVGFGDPNKAKKRRVIEENESDIQDTDSKISLVSEPKIEELSEDSDEDEEGCLAVLWGKLQLEPSKKTKESYHFL